MTRSTRPPSTSTCRPLCARGSQAGRAGASVGTAAHTLESVDCTLAYEHRCVCPANAGEYSCRGRGLWFRYQVLNGSPMLWSTIVATVVAMFFMDLYQAPLCLQPPIGGRGMLYAIRHHCYPSPLYVVRDQVALWMFFVDQYEAPLAPRPPSPRCADIVYRGFQAANRVAHDGHTVSPSFRCIASTPSCTAALAQITNWAGLDERDPDQPSHIPIEVDTLACVRPHWSQLGIAGAAAHRRRASVLQDSARRSGTRLAAPGLGSPLPHLNRDWAHRCHLHRDWAHVFVEDPGLGDRVAFMYIVHICVRVCVRAQMCPCVRVCTRACGWVRACVRDCVCVGTLSTSSSSCSLCLSLSRAFSYGSTTRGATCACAKTSSLPHLPAT